MIESLAACMEKITMILVILSCKISCAEEQDFKIRNYFISALVGVHTKIIKIIRNETNL
jgi:hypothetical protein